MSTTFTNHDALAAVCRRHGVRRLALFGSTLKGTAGPNSDVDLLVEFDRDAAPTLLTLAEMEIELGELVGGRRIDLRTPAELSRYFRDDVLREARVEYAS